MKKLGWVFWAIIIVALISASAIGLLYFLHFSSLTDSNEKWGQFGDYVGGTLNPILGLLSLIVLLLVYKQNKEELELTRVELNNSATALKEQSETLEIQRFEQTFFSLLELHNKITYEFNYEAARGLVALRLLVKPTSFSYYDQNQYTITRHCKIIIRIIEFLDHANISDKLLYSGLLRDSLINEELVLLCQEIMKISECDKIFKLLCKYNIFENFDFNNANHPFPHLEALKQELELAQRLAEN